MPRLKYRVTVTDQEDNIVFVGEPQPGDIFRLTKSISESAHLECSLRDMSARLLKVAQRPGYIKHQFMGFTPTGSCIVEACGRRAEDPMHYVNPT